MVNIDNNLIDEFLKDILNDCKENFKNVEDDVYHHNRSYKSTPSVIRNGILSAKSRAKLEGYVLSKEKLERLNDINHVNGSDYVSLAILDSKYLDFSKAYENEMIYSPLPEVTDIIVSGKVNALHVTTNYYNEFLVEDQIPNVFFNSVDIRFLQIKKNENKVLYYKYLKEIAQAMIDAKLDIPLRELSLGITLDKPKVLKLPDIKLNII